MPCSGLFIMQLAATARLQFASSLHGVLSLSSMCSSADVHSSYLQLLTDSAGLQQQCSFLAAGDKDFSSRTVRILSADGTPLGTGSYTAHDEVTINYHVVFDEDVTRDQNGKIVTEDVVIPVTARGLTLTLFRHHKALDIAVLKVPGGRLLHAAMPHYPLQRLPQPVC